MKKENWIARWLKAPFRFHDFDLENVQCINQGSLDKDVTGNPHALLYFFAFCKHCGKPVQVSRQTYIDDEPFTWWQRWFCVRDPGAYKIYAEQARERRDELTPMDTDAYKMMDEWLESHMLTSADKRAKNLDEKP